MGMLRPHQSYVRGPYGVDGTLGLLCDLLRDRLGSPAVLRKAIKEVRAPAILPTIEKSAKYFQIIEASFIWGYPYETLEDFLQTLDLAAAAANFAPIVNVQLHMLSSLPSSPVLSDFTGELQEPEVEDRPWLLLPGLLVDHRAAAVRAVIDQAPDLFPGFFTFPTPDKAAKRARLQRVRKALHRALGRSVFDEDIGRLLVHGDAALEARLITEAGAPEERIGVGVALSWFRRIRWQRTADPTQRLAGARGPAVVRERNDMMSAAAS